MNLNLFGKNALICGGSKGLGRATAIEIAALGANVTLVARNANTLAEALHELDKSRGQDHDFLVADFSNAADLKRKITGLTATKHIHILVNNTGGPPSGAILEADPESFSQAFHNHVICNHLLTQAVLKGMKQDEYGRIINIISTSVKQPIRGLGVSNTTRGAVANWAKTVAHELAPFGITVNNVLPGSTRTERLLQLIDKQSKEANLSFEEMEKRWLQAIPMQRFGKPEEIGAAIAFLASPAASYITGTNVTVDGGKTQSL